MTEADLEPKIEQYCQGCSCLQEQCRSWDDCFLWEEAIDEREQLKAWCRRLLAENADLRRQLDEQARKLPEHKIGGRMDIEFEWVDQYRSWIPVEGWRVNLRFEDASLNIDEAAFIERPRVGGVVGDCYLRVIARPEVSILWAILDAFKQRRIDDRR